MLTKSIEAILFSIGRRIDIDELSKLTREKDKEKILSALKSLKNKYNQSDTPITLEDDGKFWKMNIKDEHVKTVRKVVKQMELPKTILETLAVVAWKAPVLQSAIIKIRTNKAYDHLDYLEKEGFINRRKYGRTKLINLSQKFYDYFEINKKGGLGRVFRRITERAKKRYPHLTEPKVEVIEEKLGPLDVYDTKQEVEIIDKDDVSS